MPDPRWTGPPEFIALIFEAGTPLSTLANNAVWVTETANKEIAAGLSTVNAFATATQWQGVSGLTSMVTSTGLNAGLHSLVGWTAHKIGVTQTAVEAFVTARSGVIPSMVSQTNRDEWMVLNATNFFGQNTPGIVERDTEYFGEHWPQNSGIGWSYSAALSALAAMLAVPPPLAPLGASPAAPAAAASAVGEAAAQGGMNTAMQASSQATSAARRGRLGARRGRQPDEFDDADADADDAECDGANAADGPGSDAGVPEHRSVAAKFDGVLGRDVFGCRWGRCRRGRCRG